MKDFLRSNIAEIEWLLGGIAVILPSIAWFSRANLGELTLYDVFPPLGLIAFGLMWTHFVMSALRRYAGVAGKKRDVYAVISMGLVLALILLHPGLFFLALYMDGYGLPPQSYIEAYSTQLGFLALGTVGLMIFLAYELKRFFGEKKWWKYIGALQIVGMIAIFIHAIGIGSDLAMDWFMVVWIFYGITLAAAIVYTEVDKRNKAKA